MLLNSTGVMRRLTLLVIVFVVLFLILRNSAYNSYTDYLPSIKSPFASSEYDASTVSSTAPLSYGDEIVHSLKPEYNEAPNFDAELVQEDRLATEEDGVAMEETEGPEEHSTEMEDEETVEEDSMQSETEELGTSQSEEQEQGDSTPETEIHSTTTETAQETQSSSPRSRLDIEMQELLTWDPPIDKPKHYPPYDAYSNRDFDPNRWEGFEENTAFFLNGTTDKLLDNLVTPAAYNVHPAYNTGAWMEKWKGEYVPCNGPAGVPYNQSSDSHFVRAYSTVPDGFPAADVGSFEAVGLDGNVCFDRHARLDPYRAVSGHEELDFSKVKWGKLQNKCLERNSERYMDGRMPVLKASVAKPTTPIAPGPEGAETTEDASLTEEVSTNTMLETAESPDGRISPRQTSDSLQYKSRSAVLLRVWGEYDYQENDHIAIRSLINELSLQSGGEYQVFLFVQVKDLSVPLFDDAAVYAQKLAECVPEEFRDIAILWNEKIGQTWYPEVGEWSVYFQAWMPLQWFAMTHPEFEHIWNWEMDARYIGNQYHFLEQISNFARKQPRKYLWERNSRFYIPAVHGTWDNFVNETNDIVANSPYVDTVWGPQRWIAEQEVSGPTPPTTEEDDQFEWGVGDEADLITLLPMWDPRDTLWAYRNKLWGYPQMEDAVDEKIYLQIPRRTFINTLVRLSSKLLRAMHDENEKGQSMATEMWPSSVSLQHGLKAVYAPHPIWLTHQWPAKYLDLVINADGWGAGAGVGGVDEGHGAAYSEERELQGLPQNGTGPTHEGKAGRWSAERDSAYSPDREHNFGGFSWYFWTDFPRTLYWRWLGWSSEITIPGSESDTVAGGSKILDWTDYEKQHGRLCLPGMLIHPVKNVVDPSTQFSSSEVAEQADDGDHMPVDGLPVDDLDVANPLDTGDSSSPDNGLQLEGAAAGSSAATDTLSDTDGNREDGFGAAVMPDEDAANAFRDPVAAEGFGVLPPTLAAGVAGTLVDSSADDNDADSSPGSDADDFGIAIIDPTDDDSSISSDTTDSSAALDANYRPSGFPIDVSQNDIDAATADDAQSDTTSAPPLDPSRPFGGPPMPANAPFDPSRQNYNHFLEDGSLMPPAKLDAILPGDASWPGGPSHPSSHHNAPALDSSSYYTTSDDNTAAEDLDDSTTTSTLDSSSDLDSSNTSQDYNDNAGMNTEDLRDDVGNGATWSYTAAVTEDGSSSTSSSSQRLRPGQVSEDAYGGAFGGGSTIYDDNNDDTMTNYGSSTRQDGGFNGY